MTAYINLHLQYGLKTVIYSIKLMIYQPDELHIHLCLGKSVIIQQSKHQQALANNKFTCSLISCHQVVENQWCCYKNM